jgi:hypothetical protein
MPLLVSLVRSLASHLPAPLLTSSPPRPAGLKTRPNARIPNFLARGTGLGLSVIFRPEKSKRRGHFWSTRLRLILPVGR